MKPHRILFGNKMANDEVDFREYPEMICDLRAKSEKKMSYMYSLRQPNMKEVINNNFTMQY